MNQSLTLKIRGTIGFRTDIINVCVCVCGAFLIEKKFSLPPHFFDKTPLISISSSSSISSSTIKEDYYYNIEYYE